MLEIPIEDFLSEMEMELSCYDGIDEDAMDDFKRDFNHWCQSEDGQKEMNDPALSITFQDEDHFFSTISAYVISLMEAETDTFWKHFSDR